MITLALAEVVYFIALQAPFTGGEDGVQGVPSGTLFGLVNLDNPLAMYFFTLAVYLVGIGIIYRAVPSPFGQVLRAVRENESRALAPAYAPQHEQPLPFVPSA